MKSVSIEHEIEDLLDQAYESRVNKLPDSIQLVKRAIELSQEVYPALHAKALNMFALFSMINGEFTHSLTLSEQALIFFDKNKDLKGIANAKYNIASCYYKTNNFHEGLNHFLDCLKLYRQLDDHHNEARVLKAMGTIYEYFGDQENAINSYLQSIEVAEKVNDLNQVSNAYNPLSGIYLKQHKAEMAHILIEKSISLKEKTKDVRGLAFALYGRGKVSLYLEKHDKALEDFEKSLEIQRLMGDKLGEGMVLNKIGLVHLKRKCYDTSEKILLESVQLAEKHGIQFILFRAYYNLYKLYAKKEETDKALKSLEQYIQAKEVVINNQTINVIKSYESIKKIEALENEAKRQKEKAEIIERKNAELDSFFYRISHDLKGPISSLLGLYNLVKLDFEDEKVINYFNMYQTQIQRINNIVMDLINLTRMDHDQQSKSMIDFNALIKECLVSYNYMENFDKINFSTHVDPNLTYYSEWAILNTIMQNLIENAIKYIRFDEIPYVGVFVSQYKDHVEIKVEDNGQGIRAQDQKRIFDMFYRANDKVQGTGLGLYILKRAVERLHGEISVYSEINAGATFIVKLPHETKEPK